MLNTLYRTLGTALSPSGANARLSIMIYHRVLPEIDEIFPSEVTADFFNAQLIALKKVFNILPLGEAVARLKSNSLPARAACITFDDGYADNATIALPILQRHGLHATFFIATSYLNGGRMFNDTVIHAIRNSQDNTINLSSLGLGEHVLDSTEAKRLAIEKILKKVKYLPMEQRIETAETLSRIATDTPPPSDLMMDSSQLLMLANAGMEIGGHTANHPILAKLDTNAARREIAEGTEYLQSLLAEKVKLFAYPNGKPGLDYLPEHVDLIKKLGFDAAVSTQWGAAHHNSDIFQLPRFTPYSSNISRFTPMLLKNLIRETN